jgi:hypothetical protein
LVLYVGLGTDQFPEYGRGHWPTAHYDSVNQTVIRACVSLCDRWRPVYHQLVMIDRLRFTAVRSCQGPGYSLDITELSQSRYRRFYAADFRQVLQPPFSVTKVAFLVTKGGKRKDSDAARSKVETYSRNDGRRGAKNFGRPSAATRYYRYWTSFLHGLAETRKPATSQAGNEARAA